MFEINGFDFWNMEAEKYWSPTDKSKVKLEAQSDIFSNNYIGARKVDGNWGMMIKDDEGNIAMRGRARSVNGDYLNKIEWIPHLKKEFERLPNGTVFLGELYLPHSEGSKNVTTILGCLKDKAVARQEKGEKLSYYIFDCLAYNGQLLLNTPLVERFKYAGHFVNNCKQIEFAEYFCGQELWDMIGYYLENGYEGAVIQNPYGLYEPGKRPAHKSLKIKKELATEIDCFLTGNYKGSTKEYTGKEIEEWEYWLDIRSDKKLKGNFFKEYATGEMIEPITKGYYYGWAGSIEIGVVKDGKIESLGWISNVPEEVKKEIVENPDKWKYKVVRVQAMEIDKESKKLRHGRIVEWRSDKSWQDCDYEQI